MIKVGENILDPATVETTIIFYPIASARIDDRIQIVGTGFKYITDINSYLPYFNIYPWLKMNIMERYATKRNLDPQKIALISKMLDRSGAIAAASTNDVDGDTENSKRDK
jgi:hypothetical protein